MNLGKFGWVVTTGLLALMVRAGMQPETEKIGFVNVGNVYDKSVAMEKSRNDLQNVKASWQQLGDFVGLNPAFKPDDLKRLKVLWTKEARTPAEDAELTKLKTDAQFATKRFDELRQKPTPTAGETAEMNDLGKRALDDAQAVKAWQVDLSNQFDALQASKSAQAEAEVLAALTQVAKSKSLTIVFSEKAAAYGVMDITDDVRKAVDKNNK